MYRERNCDNPPPKGEGKDCSHLGPYTERKPCIIKECPGKFVLHLASFHLHNHVFHKE